MNYVEGEYDSKRNFKLEKELKSAKKSLSNLFEKSCKKKKAQKINYGTKHKNKSR